jgi:chromosome segregation ATPase
MRRILSWAAAAAIFAIPASGWCQQADPKPGQQDQAQTSAPSSGTANSGTTHTSSTPPAAPQQESLADAARKTRETKKDATKPAKVFTNDNLPGEGGISTVGNTAAAPKDGVANATDATAAPESSEKAWRDKFAGLRAKMARDQEDLSVMQRELGVLDLQNYSDPTKAMQQELTRGDINKKTSDIDAKAQQIKADQQAIDDAEDALRKGGGDSGWAR